MGESGSKRFRRDPDGVLPFPKARAVILNVDDGDCKYVTQFGPRWHNPASEVYSAGDKNLSVALSRIDGRREDEEALTRNNKRISPLSVNRGASRFVDSYHRKIKSAMSEALHHLGDDIEEQVKNACLIDHDKYKLRVKAIRELMFRREVINSLFMENSKGNCHITGKVKIPEFAKFGKKSRLIGDFSCPGSLLAAFLVPIMKYAMSSSVEVSGATFKFQSSTKMESLRESIREMDESTGSFFLFFSDDIICKIVNSDGESWFNLDISSCDSSNGPSVFERLHWYFEESGQAHGLMDRAIRQCQQPLKLFGERKKGLGGEDIKEYIMAKSREPLEFSGTQLTTLLNNIASVSICLSIHYHSVVKASGRETLETVISKSAFAFGYKMTFQRCPIPEKLQFLKHSFSRRGDFLEPWFNLGPFFRSAGTCFMDLAFNRSKGETLEGAARARNWQNLTCMTTNGTNPLFEHLSNCPGFQNPKTNLYTIARSSVIKEKSFSHQNVDCSVTSEELRRRYDFSPDELEHFLSVSYDIFQEISSPLISKVLYEDYAYPVLTT